MTFPNAQSNPAAAIPVWLAPAPAAAGVSVKNITTATNTQVKTGAGTLLGLTINTPQSGATATVYDGTSTAGTKLGTFSLATQTAMSFPGGGTPFATGLFVVTAGGTPADITLTYL